ncbi:ATP-binding protein [Amycolatopsis sp. NPDC021455]|uniref:ATP-binding protein n=1 Tax=Amycolatopsis sp. NPDC021455 TaxID=3154901 RepID=UPI0033ED79D6
MGYQRRFAGRTGPGLLRAVHEAMADVVVHAYPDRPGTSTLQAGTAVTITIRDHDQWQPAPRSGLLGGRGLPLIHTWPITPRSNPAQPAPLSP